MSQETPGDAELIHAHLQGSPTAMAQLWLRYDRLVYGIAHSVVSNNRYLAAVLKATNDQFFSSPGVIFRIRDFQFLNSSRIVFRISYFVERPIRNTQ